MSIQPLDGRRAVLVDPGEIQAGKDSMRDMGRLRIVESVEASTVAGSILIRFSDVGDGQFSTLSVPENVTVTVWRAVEQPEASRVRA